MLLSADRREGPNGKLAWKAALAAGAVHLALALIAIVTRVEGTSEWFDQKNYHLPVIRAFSEALPAPNLADYQSATTPGYHLVMAVLLKFVGESLPLFLVNAAFGVALVSLAALIVARLAGVAAGVAGGLFLGASPYVLSSSVWLTTDNFATLALTAAFLTAIPIATHATKYPLRAGLFAAGYAALAAFVRQILAYAAAFPGAAIVARAVGERRLPRVSELAAASLALLPALLVVAIFVWLWGGLVPPSFRQYHGGGANPVTPVYVLAVVAVWAFPVFVGIPNFLREFLSLRMLILGVLAAIVACAVPSSYIVHVRFGGILWAVAEKLPAPMERSIVLVPLAGFGAAAIGAYLRVWSRNSCANARALGVYALLAMVGMTVAQTANSQCFERYVQPPVVLFALVAAAAIARAQLRAWPILAMTAIALGLSLVNVYRVGAG